MRQDTKLVHLGRNTAQFEGTVNLPVHRASTILSPDVESYIHRFDGDNRFTNITYGATGTHNARALREAIGALEDAQGCIVTSSGLSCITMTLSALLGAGDHALITDSAYGPTRNFCVNVLTRYGVEITFYDPMIGAGVESLIRDNTRLVYTEAPRFTHFRDARHTCNLGGRQKARFDQCDRQHLGHANFFPTVGSRCRCVAASRHQVHSRSLGLGHWRHHHPERIAPSTPGGSRKDLWRCAWPGRLLSGVTWASHPGGQIGTPVAISVTSGKVVS